MVSESRYPIGFSGGIARVDGLASWLGLTAAATLLLGPLRWLIVASARRGRRRRLHRLVRIWADALIAALDVELAVSGLDRIDPDQQYVVAPLHEGLIDPVIVTRLPLDLSFAVRDELFTWRFLGSYLRSSEQTCIASGSGRSGYRAMLRGAQTALERGESFVVFPQGSILGIEAAFSAGAFRTAHRLGVPVLPVVISGTHRVWEHPYRPIVRRRQSVRLEVLEPVQPTRSNDQMRSTERAMKRAALDGSPAPRRYEPERDGWWDEYRIPIDPDFSHLVERVRDHRAANAAGRDDQREGVAQVDADRVR